MSIFTWLERKLKERRDNELLAKYGGIQTCPWCKQCAQEKPGWKFTQWVRDPFLDVLTCGVCAGTSLWHFTIGMVYVAPLDPPTPDVPTLWLNGHYDVENTTWVQEDMPKCKPPRVAA